MEIAAVTLKNSMLVCLWIAPRAPQTLVQGQGGSHCVCVTAPCPLFCRGGGLWAHAGPHVLPRSLTSSSAKRRRATRVFLTSIGYELLRAHSAVPLALCKQSFLYTRITELSGLLNAQKGYPASYPASCTYWLGDFQ